MRLPRLSQFELIKCLSFSLILVIIGSIAIILAILTSNESLSMISLTIGITCIISVVTIIVESFLREENIKLTDSYFTKLKSDSDKQIISLTDKTDKVIKALTEKIDIKTKVIEERMGDMDRKLELAGKMVTSGISDILSERWENEDEYHATIKKYLMEYYNQIVDKKEFEKEIWIMGIALRHFFQLGTYKKELNKLNELGVTFKILLLDAKSEAAKRRSKIESPNIYEAEYLEGSSYMNDDALFVDTPMFKDLSDTYDCITQTPAPLWIKNFQVKYFENDPSFYLIKFPDKILLETYHLGSASECKILSDRPINFSGGRIPIFIYKSKSVTYELISNHFLQIWRCSQKTPQINEVIDFFLTSNKTKNEHLSKKNQMHNMHREEAPKM